VKKTYKIKLLKIAPYILAAATLVGVMEVKSGVLGPS
jgi:hypothetical protein